MNKKQYFRSSKIMFWDKDWSDNLKEIEDSEHEKCFHISIETKSEYIKRKAKVIENTILEIENRISEDGKVLSLNERDCKLVKLISCKELKDITINIDNSLPDLKFIENF